MIVAVLLAATTGLPAGASAASWWWSRKFEASLRVTHTAVWQSPSARPCDVMGTASWEFDAHQTRGVPVRVEFFGGGYVTRGEGGYRVTDAGRRRHYALPAIGTASADVVQQPTGDPDYPCDAQPDLSRCATRAFPQRYTGGFLDGQIRVGRLGLHIEDLRSPDDLPSSPNTIPCVSFVGELPGWRQTDILGTDHPVRRVFRSRIVVFRGERRYRPRRWGIEVGGIAGTGSLNVTLSWELRLRAAGRLRQQCSYETPGNRCPRL
jgi:hypothetical protein